MRKITQLLLAGAGLAMLTAGTVAHASAAASQNAPKPVAATPALAVTNVKVKKPKPSPKPEVSAWTDDLWADAAWPRLGLDDPFLDVDAMVADMDRQMAAMTADLSRLQRDAGATTTISTGSASAICGESLAITQVGNAPPRVERHVYGHCARANAPSSSAPVRDATRSETVI